MSARQGAPADGVLCEGRIICPCHAGAFNSVSGALLEPVPLTGLHSHDVQLVDGTVLVDTDPLPPYPIPPVSDHRVFVLVGPGATAASAATTLQAGGFGDRLVLIGPNDAEPLGWTQLSKMALAQPDFHRDTLPLLDAEMLATLRVLTAPLTL